MSALSNVERQIKRFDSLKQSRGIWETHWQDIIDYIVPNQQDVITQKSPGLKKGQFIFDNTAAVSGEVLTSALHAMLTNPNTTWFELSPRDPRLAANERVREYLQEFTQTLHDILNNTNFQTEIHQYFSDLVHIGTASMAMEENEKKIVQFGTRHISEYVVGENNEGMVDEWHARFFWEANQVVQEFTKDVFGKKVDTSKLTKDELEKQFGRKLASAFVNNSSDKFCIQHSIYKKDLIEATKKPYESCYILKDEKIELKEGGFRRFPYICSRWWKTSGEIYGRSPAMIALSEVKTLNQMVKALIQGAQKVVNPPMQLPDDGFFGSFKTAPGSIHYFRSGTQDRAEPIFKNSIDVGIGEDLIQGRQLQIKQAFFVDKFNLVQNDRMTTVEVNQRVEEQLRFLSPMMGRQRSETLIPLIDRLIDIVVEADAGSGKYLGDVPPELVNIQIDAQYTSPIARAQIITQGQNMIRAIEASKSLFELDPNAVDIINADAGVRENFRIYGAPQKVLRKTDDVEQIRQAKQEAQQQALQKMDDQANTEQVAKLAPVMQNKGL